MGAYVSTVEGEQHGRMLRLADLAKHDERWERLLNDPDGMFTGEETVEEAYCEFLAEVLAVMERYECTFCEAAKLSATDTGESGDAGIADAGIADYLKARRSGWPAYQALVYNLRAIGLGPDRAELCAWRRSEARAALERGCLAAEAAEGCLAKGIACTDQELAEVDETLLQAKELCYGLDQALEILQANSTACGEGEDVMAEYEELLVESADCNAKLRTLADMSHTLRQRHWRLISSAGQALLPACLPGSLVFGKAAPRHQHRQQGLKKRESFAKEFTRRNTVS